MRHATMILMSLRFHHARLRIFSRSHADVFLCYATVLLVLWMARAGSFTKRHFSTAPYGQILNSSLDRSAVGCCGPADYKIVHKNISHFYAIIAVIFIEVLKHISLFQSRSVSQCFSYYEPLLVLSLLPRQKLSSCLHSKSVAPIQALLQSWRWKFLLSVLFQTKIQ